MCCCFFFFLSIVGKTRRQQRMAAHTVIGPLFPTRYKRRYFEESRSLTVFLQPKVLSDVGDGFRVIAASLRRIVYL